MQKYSPIIIGGGPAGMISAISSKRSGGNPIILERMPKPGKKLLISGGGRCNLLNENLDESYYNSYARPLVNSVFSKFGKNDIKSFFDELGLKLYSEGGRIFPVTNQASSVLKVLEIELSRQSIPLELNFEVFKITHSEKDFEVISKNNKKIQSQKIIIAGGGKTYPALGSNGNAYELARSFGHNIIEPVPAEVPLVVKHHFCHLLQGQKVFSKVKSIVDGKESEPLDGELLFTKYGLSGPAILGISSLVSIAINRSHKKDVKVSVDLVPFLSKEEMEKEIAKRRKKGIHENDILSGILSNKLSSTLGSVIKDKIPSDAAKAIKNIIFDVSGTRGWNEADFTYGGVDVSEIKESSLESKLIKNLYFAGEITDVGAKKGGYNLAWAWASGFVAGLTQ